MGLILGPFELQGVLGEGGMGVVWRGLHLAQQVPVAVKVLSRRRSWELAHVESFRREAKAMARLNHPHIVHVLDCGFVDASAAKQPGSDLAEGTPYLAVELAPHGALDGLGRKLTWGEVRHVLLAVLDALAHAHARGVIHRDIKPPNVLVFDPRPGRLEVKLTDFGIAHALDEQTREGVVEESAGTPDYMAPEQFQGLWRDQGPWTDLYALGCMAYEMASGGVPFRAETFLEYAYKHIRKPPPEFVPRAGFPLGFGAWLNRAMAKDPRERFQRAADAAWALQRLTPDLDDAGRVFSLGAPSEVGARRALGLASTLDAAAPVVVAAPPVLRLKTLGYGESVPAPRETPQAEVRSTGTTRQAAGLDPWGGALAVSLPQQDAPPVPEDWRRALRPTPSMRLVGAGLGLYGLRSVPLLGRERERDAIWADLREVAARRAARLVLLRGASGVGTSRLAEWISQRAHELGVATVLKALHSEMGGPSDGVGRMLARHLGCAGLTRAQALERLRRVVVWQGLSPDEAELEAMALVELVVPGPDGGPRVKLHLPAQRYALVRRFFERLGRERPLVLWLEDVQWGADALGLAEALLQDGGGPWLILMTALDEGLARRPDEAAALARLTEGPHARELELAPLNPQERKTLVEGLLCLSGELAAQVEERCGGNPMFAVQLVGDWVRRGLLEVTPQGFALKDNHRALPDDLRRLAEERIELALASLPLAAHTSLEVAAALGLRVDAREWDEVCRYAGAEPPPNVLGALLDHRLLEPAEDGWAFALGIVREVLEQRAKESGAWALLNLSCAYALSSALRNKDPKATPWRVGRHFFEAQEWDQAASALGHAAQEGLRRGAFAQAWEALDLKARALTHLGLDPHAARWGEVKLRQVELAEFQGRWAEAKVWAHEAAAIAQRGGHAPLLAEARRRLGNIACAQGRFDEALAFYGGALAEHGWLGDGLGEAKVLVGLGDVSRQLGRLALARERYALGLARCDALGHAKEVERVRARLLHGLGLAALQGRAFDEARGWLSQAQALDEQRGERLHAAECEAHLGDLDRLEGRLDEAQARYQRALDVGVALGSGLAPHARLGLAHLYLARGWAAQAQELLSHCLDAFAHSGERDDLARAHAALLVCLAQAHDWPAWDQHLLQASQVFAETQRADLDAVECLRAAEDLARAAGEPQRAARARALREAQHARWGA